MSRPDSAQLAAAAGSALGYVLTNYDRLAAAACALAGLGYTLWKWRNDAREKAAARAVR